MPDLIQVTRDYSVLPLFPITDDNFAHMYGLGVFWALYGDEQGKGWYEDRYLSGNIDHNLRTGRYDAPDSPWFAHSGFYFGMVHGGNIEPGSHRHRLLETLVEITDYDFSLGYQDGRQSFAGLTDAWLARTLLAYAHTAYREESVRYETGWISGVISLTLIPLHAYELR